VAQSVHYLLSAGEDDKNMLRLMSDLDLLAVIISALVHDYEHPGLSNSFLIATKDKLALTYNDISVLENQYVVYHSS